MKLKFSVLLAGSLFLSQICAGGFRFGLGNAAARRFAEIADRTASPNTPPTNLTMPVSIQNIHTSPMDPYGIVRWSLDTNGGHPGIDLTISTGNPIFAVADGIIVNINDSHEQNPGGGGVLPGVKITLLIGNDASVKSGWVFFYESVDLEPGIALNSRVARGQIIGRDAGVGHHLELAYAFDNFSTRDIRACWADQLAASERADFLNFFNNTMRVSAPFINYWQNNQREGKFPFRELLNTSRYPNGAQLCYPPGTDVR